MAVAASIIRQSSSKSTMNVSGISDQQQQRIMRKDDDEDDALSITALKLDDVLRRGRAMHNGGRQQQQRNYLLLSPNQRNSSLSSVISQGTTASTATTTSILLRPSRPYRGRSPSPLRKSKSARSMAALELQEELLAHVRARRHHQEITAPKDPLLGTKSLSRIRSHKSDINALRPARRRIKWDAAAEKNEGAGERPTKLDVLQLDDLNLFACSPKKKPQPVIKNEEQKSSPRKGGRSPSPRRSPSRKRNESPSRKRAESPSRKRNESPSRKRNDRKKTDMRREEESKEARESDEDSVSEDDEEDGAKAEHPANSNRRKVSDIFNDKKKKKKQVIDPTVNPGEHLDLLERQIRHCCKLIRRVERQTDKLNASTLEQENQALRRQLLDMAAVLPTKAEQVATQATCQALRAKATELDEQIGMLKMQKRNLDADTTILKEIAQEQKAGAEASIEEEETEEGEEEEEEDETLLLPASLTTVGPYAAEAAQDHTAHEEEEPSTSHTASMTEEEDANWDLLDRLDVVEHAVPPPVSPARKSSSSRRHRKSRPCSSSALTSSVETKAVPVKPKRTPAAA